MSTCAANRTRLQFFVNTYKRGISYVSIYIGNGDVVHAMIPKLGAGVADVNNGHWTAHCYGAIRPSRQAARRRAYLRRVPAR